MYELILSLVMVVVNGFDGILIASFWLLTEKEKHDKIECPREV